MYAILGEGWVSLTSYFSMDKILGTGYDIHLLCAMIADHVTLLTISLRLKFLGGRIQVVNLPKQFPYFFQFFASC